MKERPIIMQAESVRAILDGRKTQTRRVVKFENANDVDKWLHHQGVMWRMGVMGEGGTMANMGVTKCPHGQPGDRLWVRETYSLTQFGKAVYRADGKDQSGMQWGIEPGDPSGECLWRSPMFMPKKSSRITLELLNIRVERVQSISGPDIWAEGMTKEQYEAAPGDYAWYRDRWQSINGKESWAANPWVWVLEFKRINP